MPELPPGHILVDARGGVTICRTKNYVTDPDYWRRACPHCGPKLVKREQREREKQPDPGGE